MKPGPKPHHSTLDHRIPVPSHPHGTACQTEPDLFNHDDLSTDAAIRDVPEARKKCRTCPLAEECLKFALVNPEGTRSGVWAATTPRERTRLRQRMASRLGPNWTDVITQPPHHAQQRPQVPSLALVSGTRGHPTELAVAS